MPQRIISIKFTCDNAAFEDGPEVEIARILRSLAERVEADPRQIIDGMTIRDVNGNTVGSLQGDGFSDTADDNDDDDGGAASEARQQHRMSYGRDPDLD